MNRGELKKYTRFLLDQFGTGWIADDDANVFDLNEALFEGYRKYAKETNCFKINYNLTATADQAIYKHSDFGTSSAGARVFARTMVGYDSKELAKVSVEYLDSVFPNWRWEASSTPEYVIPWGEGSFRIYPAPDQGLTLYLEGFETPVSTDLDNDNDIPQIHEDDHRLICVWAAMLVVTRGAVGEMAVKTPTLLEGWQQGIQAAKMRIASGEGQTTLLGSIGQAMDLGELKKLVGFLLGQAGVNLTVSVHDLKEAIRSAYRNYAGEVRLFRDGFTCNSVSGTGVYSFSQFGSGSGSRFSQIAFASFDDDPISLVDVNYLNGTDPGWRSADYGTPNYIVPWGKRKILLHPTPDSIAEIYLEGFVYPDMSLFNSDSHLPDIDQDDHYLLAIGAVIILLERAGATPEVTASFKERWTAGIEKRKAQSIG